MFSHNVPSPGNVMLFYTTEVVGRWSGWMLGICKVQNLDTLVKVKKKIGVLTKTTILT